VKILYGGNDITNNPAPGQNKPNTGSGNPK
jgi:hypothetical protein